MLVVGCGESVVGIPRKPTIPSIGVNHCWKWVETQYLLVLGEPIEQHYTIKNRGVINYSTPEAFFMTEGGQKAWEQYWSIERNIVSFTRDFPNEGVPIRQKKIYAAATESSIGTALGIALYMGAKRVGVIGVDITNHPHLSQRIDTYNDCMSQMNGVAAAYGSQIYNLSPQSALDAFPFISFEEFLDNAVSNNP